MLCFQAKVRKLETSRVVIVELLSYCRRSETMATSRWKLEDLHDLEQVGLAAELESTNLGDLGGQQTDFEAYNMRYCEIRLLGGILLEVMS